MQIMHTRTGTCTGTGDYAAASLIFELRDVVQTKILLLSLLRQIQSSSATSFSSGSHLSPFVTLKLATLKYIYEPLKSVIPVATAYVQVGGG